MSVPSTSPALAHRVQSSRRNRQIVEGALLADIAVVLLLGRVYLPIPIVRTVWRLLAAAPFVLVAQRQGIRIAVMSGIVAYLLLTVLVGPTLALPALDTAFAALIVAIGMQRKLPRMVVGVIGGLVYAVCDVIIPTIFFAALFRVPVSTMVGDVGNGMRGSFHLIAEALKRINHVLADIFGPTAPRIPFREEQIFGTWLTHLVIGNWVIVALCVAVAMGIVNVFAYQAATDLVLSRLPATVRTAVDD